MNIDALTIGEARQIMALLGSTKQDAQPHPLEGKRVVWIGTHGFIWVGTLRSQSGLQYLADADNIRYWETRSGGLPELARNGYSGGDKIDRVGTVYPAACVAIYPCGDWSNVK